MRQRSHVCPNCEMVMDLHYDPDAVEVAWYECPICGHQVDADGFRPVDTEMPRVPRQREF